MPTAIRCSALRRVSLSTGTRSGTSQHLHLLRRDPNARGLLQLPPNQALRRQAVQMLVHSDMEGDSTSSANSHTLGGIVDIYQDCAGQWALYRVWD